VQPVSGDWRDKVKAARKEERRAKKAAKAPQSGVLLLLLLVVPLVMAGIRRQADTKCAACDDILSSHSFTLTDVLSNFIDGLNPGLQVSEWTWRRSQPRCRPGGVPCWTPAAMRSTLATSRRRWACSSILVECNLPMHGSFIMFMAAGLQKSVQMVESWGLPVVNRPPLDRPVQETSWERPT
jgi:hypothetical protein